MPGDGHDPEREKFDRLILMGTASLRISQEMGGRKYTGLRMTNHRDRHLLPLDPVRDISLTLDVLLAVPYPRDGTVPERGWCILSQLAGVREIALREGELNVAVTCLREMRTVDKEMLIGQPRDGSRKCTAGRNQPGGSFAGTRAHQANAGDDTSLRAVARRGASRQRGGRATTKPKAGATIPFPLPAPK